LNRISNEILFVRKAPVKNWHAAMPKNVNQYTYCHNFFTWLLTLLFKINNSHNLDPGLQEQRQLSNIATKILLPEYDKDTALQEDKRN
jgi:hypothetical protein